MNRYQFQPWYVKAYRQVRYSPKWFVVAVFKLLWWVLMGCRHESSLVYFARTRWQTPSMIWKWSRVMASIDMNHCWYIEEMIEKLRSKA